MALSTTQSIWRSGGGDQTRTAYCGSMQMVAQFYFSATQTTGNVLNAAGGQSVILPAGAIILEIQANGAATGGASPTFDIGFTTYFTGSASPQALVNEGVAGKQVVNWASGTVGTSMGAVMSATELVYITGRAGTSAPTGGNISGYITYYIADNGQQSA